MEPKLKQMDETLITKRKSVSQLLAEKAEKVHNCKEQEDLVNALKLEVESLKNNSDQELMEVKLKLEGKNAEKNVETIITKF